MEGIDPSSVPDDLLTTLSKAALVEEIVRLRALLRHAHYSTVAAHATSARARDDALALSTSAIAADLRAAHASGTPLPLEPLMFMRRVDAGLPESGPLAGECCLCQGDLADEDSVYVMPTCAHAMCTQCVAEQVVTGVQSNSMSELACPHIGCSSPIPQSEVRLLLEQAGQVGLWDKYCHFSVETYLMGTGNASVCPKCEIQFIVEHNSPEVECPHCKVKFCGHCPGKPDWHAGSNCEQYQTWKRENGQADEAFETMLSDAKSRIKPCPKCHAPVFKPARTDGGACNYMTCRCGNKFCFLCLAGPLEASHHAHFALPGPCKDKLFYDDPASI
jgi:hypothetical protein